MKQLLAVALNDLRVEFSERGTWMQFLVLPLIFTAVIGLGTGGLMRDPTADARYPVAVVTADTGSWSADFVTALKASQVIRVTVTDAAEAATRLAAKKAQAVVTVPAGFSANLLAGLGAEVGLETLQAGTETYSIREAVQSAAAQISRRLLAAQASVIEADQQRAFVTAAERQTYFEAGLTLAAAADQTLPVIVQEHLANQSALNTIPQGFALSSPGQLVTWVWATLLAGAATLVSERTQGTLRRLLTMPAPRWAILGGKILGRFLLGLLQMLVMILAGLWIFKVQWGNSPLALAMVMVAFGLAATALGLLLSTIVRTEQQAGGLVSLFTFLLAPLGGAWVPLEITPAAFQQLAQIFPTTWAMRGFTDVIVRGQGPQGVLLECGVLLGFAVVFFVLGVRRFKYE